MDILSKYKIDSKIFFTSLITAFLFSCANIAAYLFYYEGTLNWIYDKSTNLIKTVVAVVILTVVSCFIIYLIFSYFMKNELKANDCVDKKGNLFASCFAIIIICWLPYIVLRYPGTMHLDTIEQIIEVYYPEKSWYLFRAKGEISNHFWYNHHPIFTTLVFAVFYKIGLLIGNISFGLYIYTVCQCIAMASVFAAGIVYMRSHGINKRYSYGCLAFFALFPLNGINATTIVKDNMFIVFAIIGQLLLVELVQKESKCLHSKKFCMILAGMFFAMIMIRSNLLYVCILLLMIVVVFYRKNGIYLYVSLSIAIILALTINTVMLPIAGVAQGSKRELMSIPFQQIGRYVEEHGNELSDEDEKIISSVIACNDVDEIGNAYNGLLADPIKDMYIEDCEKKDQMKFVALWARLFFKHPGCYIQATMNTLYPTFKIFRTGEYDYASIMTKKRANYKNNTDSIIELNHTYKDVGVIYPEIFVKGSGILDKLVLVTMNIPIIRNFYLVGPYVWLFIMTMLLSILKKRKKDLIIFSLMGLNCLTLLAGPTIYIRYFYPLIVVLPILIGFTISSQKSK